MPIKIIWDTAVYTQRRGRFVRLPFGDPIWVIFKVSTYPHLSAGLELNLLLVPASRAGYYIFLPAHQPICLPQHNIGKKQVINNSQHQYRPSVPFQDCISCIYTVTLHSLSNNQKASVQNVVSLNATLSLSAIYTVNSVAVLLSR